LKLRDFPEKCGREVFEAEGVCPVYCGTNGRDSAVSYARQRAGYGHCEIQVLDENWNVAETITNKRLYRHNYLSLSRARERDLAILGE